ncbi:MAG: hypothetical protein AAF799_03120 [Myxococcota bacterium]
MEFRSEAAQARAEREEGDRARRLPMHTGRALASGALAVVFVLVGLFFAVPVGQDRRGSGQVVPADATMIRADSEGTLAWTLPVGTPVPAGGLVASIEGGSSRATLAATRATARAALVDHLRFPQRERFAVGVPDAVRQLRAEQTRAQARALYAAASGEVLLSSARPGDAIKPGDLVAVVGHRDAPMELRASFPADAKAPPQRGDTIRFRWGERTEQWANFDIVGVSYMAADNEARTNKETKPSSIQLVGVVVDEHAERLRPGLRGEVELAGSGETMAEFVWVNLAAAFGLSEAS